jgi:hypothetical protein
MKILVMYDHFQKKGFIATSEDLVQTERILGRKPTSYDAFASEVVTNGMAFCIVVLKRWNGFGRTILMMARDMIVRGLTFLVGFTKNEKTNVLTGERFQ